MKTLADMTPEQHEACVGMWATAQGVSLGAILHVNHRNAYMLFPKEQREKTYPLSSVTPRHDLPRAWNPDGTPLAGEWDYRAPYLGEYGEGLTDTEIAEFKADGDQLERRWVGDWEEIGTDGRTNNEQPSKNR